MTKQKSALCVASPTRTTHAKPICLAHRRLRLVWINACQWGASTLAERMLTRRRDDECSATMSERAC